MNDTQPDQRAEWMMVVDGDEPTAADLERFARQAAEQEKQAVALLAAQRAAFPMLHDVADGSAVDLNDVWHRLDAQHEKRGVDLVEDLVEHAGGVSRRLAAGVRSLLDRRDGNTHVCIEADPGQSLVSVLAWSTGGSFGDRAWWVRSTLTVDTDEYGEIRLRPYWGATMAVRGAGGTTVFEDNEAGPLGQVVARWYLAWEGRRGIRARAELDEITAHAEPLSLEEFLAER